MKTFISALVLAVLMFGCNSNQKLTDKQKEEIKALAEVKYTHYLNYYNELKFDSITLAYSSDAYIMADGRLITLEKTKADNEAWKKSAKSVKLRIDSLHTRVISKNAVQITSYYTMNNSDTANNNYFSKGYQTVLLDPGLKTGYISELAETNDFSPVEYAEDISPQFRKAVPNINWRNNIAKQQFQYSWIYNIAYQKQKGISAEKAAEMYVNTFISSWDKTKGFDLLSKRVFLITQSVWSQSKILQYDDNTLKIELPKDHKDWLNFIKITDEEAVVSHITAWKTISEHMGVNFSYENKENTFTMTFTRK